MKLCLGTVQFGLDYGIYNQKKPDLKDSVNILNYAVTNGIDNIDTANAYGNAESVVGAFLRQTPVKREQLFLISKLRPNILDNVPISNYTNVIKENLTASLKLLGTDYLDSYILHSSRYVFDDEIIDALTEIKKSGYVKRTGVSVYTVEEAQKCLDRNVDFMQLPFSIFDQRMLNGKIFENGQKVKTQIHSRSAFIQGLILMTETQVPDFLSKAKPILKKIDELCKTYKISRISLAMNFVKQQKAISHLVFGVDNLEQLKEDIKIFEENIPNDVIDNISAEFKNIEADIVMPSLWAKK